MAEKNECHGTPPLLRIDGLCAGYGDSAILHDITLQVAPGEVLGIVGASGSGKSTLLKAIMSIRETGLIHHAGTIQFDGRELAAQRKTTAVCAARNWASYFSMQVHH